MPIFHHVRRKRNKAADWIANKVMDEGQNYTRCEVENLSSFIGSLATGDDHLLHCRFDGGYRKLQNKASAGIRIQYSRIQSQVAKQVDLVQLEICCNQWTLFNLSWKLHSWLPLKQESSG